MAGSDPFRLAKFMLNVTTLPNGCWLWTGIGNSNGYGRFCADNKHILAHRASYEMFYGPIPAGKNVCHTCDNRRCVNPEHLWLGTQSENLKDAVAKGRMFRPDTSGENNGNRKLDWESVNHIRQLCAQGVQQKRVAKLYGVCPATVGDIIHNRIWKRAA